VIQGGVAAAQEVAMAQQAQAVALVGPTAVGKSDIAIALAQVWRGAAIEVVNADAMQLYRGMVIGTAKVDAAARTAVPHHLLDLWPIDHRASVVEFRDAARAAVGHIVDRRGLPVLVGGSGLYATAVLDDLEVPATDPEVRARYNAMLAEHGATALHAELQRRDPEAAARIAPQNGRRLVRALEVVELTGSFQARLPRDPTPWIGTQWIGLSADLQLLDAAIEARVAAMWERGLLAEVAELAEQGLADGPTASRAVGYQEALGVLSGELTRPEAMASTARRTRQLARRQLRWFRRNPRITWWNVQPGGDPTVPARQIAAFLAQRT
jgi:tRNA dimethylallyltransferase